ncbi:MAG: hypothetical protein BWY97_00378 [Tenericutes bacterium ADurb.BinA124]|nr:MAG: hypothetical protein BWY97_00378 [Tenericutes bacterium ADurb.BinA124]
MVSLGTFAVSLLVFISIGFAWISLSKSASGSLVTQVGNVEAEYAFYIYLDNSRDGSSNPSLSTNECSSGSDDACYWLIENAENPYIFGDTAKVFPDDRFSFAVKVKNIGDFDAHLSLDLRHLVSQGYDIADNKIQVAFEYEVTKITYLVAGTESADVKTSSGITLHTGHFLKNVDDRYAIVENIPLSCTDVNTKEAIVYFDLYFDPLVSGKTQLGVLTNNSNAFENQQFTISQIAVILQKQ